MQIRQQMLAQQVQKKIEPLYIIIGSDSYLLDQSVQTIKSAIQKKYNYDEKVISIQSPEDWNIIKEEANSYSLFSDNMLLNIFYDKKSLDVSGKKFLSEYPKSINTRCFILIRAPNIPAKQLQWLSSQEFAVIVLAYPLSSEAIKGWIATQLKKNSLSYDLEIPELIHQYTQGNMLACAQVIEKISLSHLPHSKIEAQQVLEHLFNQCDHDLFELVDASLLGQADKAIQILRHAANNKTEATLVLWIMSQEIRHMMQLFYLTEQKIDIQNACSQLKIWNQRVPLYKACFKRLNQVILEQLHRYCFLIDDRIKSNSLGTQVWISLENVVLSFCLGKLIGDACTV
ncbi:DNA polymerase III, delta subunit [Legionella wadsworthii]|uniref:DNA polymerase III subunit delta n=1 Tax=Legionella wadsworthii TaxID=28088 RepID=A0A378LQT2_9GAMM|nr:DNA polymerase III subunit delta [Legionella wadsworthii]STY29067.1 DNA polymerase III, delta subunit [Legionella wadsworthii]